MVPAFWKAVPIWALWHYLRCSHSSKIHKINYFLLHSLFMLGNVLEIRDELDTMSFADCGETANRVHVQFGFEYIK